MRTAISGSPSQDITSFVGMKPLSERDENLQDFWQHQ